MRAGTEVKRRKGRDTHRQVDPCPLMKGIRSPRTDAARQETTL
jgi:hypothetical protein